MLDEKNPGRALMYRVTLILPSGIETYMRHSLDQVQSLVDAKKCAHYRVKYISAPKKRKKV